MKRGEKVFDEVFDEVAWAIITKNQNLKPFGEFFGSVIIMENLSLKRMQRL